MRYPRASAVIVALSAFVAVVTVSALASQLAPVDRAGAVLPDGPITVEAQQPEPDADQGTTPAGEDSASGDAPPGGSGQESTGNATVVVPAPAETLQPEPEPEPEPEPAGPPSSPGNSGNAPGHTAEPGGPPSGQGKPSG